MNILVLLVLVRKRKEHNRYVCMYICMCYLFAYHPRADEYESSHPYVATSQQLELVQRQNYNS